MKPDAGLIVAVQRNQTGANIHTLNNMFQKYLWACYAKDHTLADRAKHDLIAVLIEKERKRAPRKTESHRFLGWSG
jgi:hypothetical protein